MKIFLAILLFVFLNSSFAKQEGKARQFVNSILHLNGISNPFFFWMISTTQFRIGTKTSITKKKMLFSGMVSIQCEKTFKTSDY